VRDEGDEFCQQQKRDEQVANDLVTLRLPSAGRNIFILCLVHYAIL